jgi:hypothetical protein
MSSFAPKTAGICLGMVLSRHLAPYRNGMSFKVRDLFGHGLLKTFGITIYMHLLTQVQGLGRLDLALDLGQAGLSPCFVLVLWDLGLVVGSRVKTLQ